MENAYTQLKDTNNIILFVQAVKTVKALPQRGGDDDNNAKVSVSEKCLVLLVYKTKKLSESFRVSCFDDITLTSKSSKRGREYLFTFLYKG
jgi:hypothetical protein